MWNSIAIAMAQALLPAPDRRLCRLTTPCLSEAGSSSARARRTVRLSIPTCAYQRRTISSSEEKKGTGVLAPPSRVCCTFSASFRPCFPPPARRCDPFFSANTVVSLLDYGAGNVRSIRNAIRYLGYQIHDVSNPSSHFCFHRCFHV